MQLEKMCCARLLFLMRVIAICSCNYYNQFSRVRDIRTRFCVHVIKKVYSRVAHWMLRNHREFICSYKFRSRLRFFRHEYRETSVVIYTNDKKRVTFFVLLPHELIFKRTSIKLGFNFICFDSENILLYYSIIKLLRATENKANESIEK